MIAGYFEKAKKRIARLNWLIEREVVETEYDEDADSGGKWGQRPIFSIVFCCAALIQKTKSHYTPEAGSATALPFSQHVVVVFLMVKMRDFCYIIFACQ